MIVKNSGEVLRKTLRSAKPYISHYTILDTGSTDNTPQIIEEEMVGISGTIHHEPFVDFSTSRNRAFELSSGTCKYYLVLDDSYELFGGDKLLSLLETTNHSSLSVRIGSLHSKVLESYYYNIRLTRCADNLRYVGKVHECIEDPNSYYITNNDIFINDMSDNDQTVRSRLRFKKDIEFLLQEYNEKPNNPRTLMYLCKTYILVKEFEKALEYFEKMQALENIHTEYHFFAKYEKACLLFGEIDHDVEKFKKRLLELTREFPTRGESFYKLSTFMYEAGNYPVVGKLLEKLVHFPKPDLFLTTQETLIYDYYVPYLYIDVNLKLGNFEKAIPKLREMLDLYPYDQPLLNIKYAIMDKSGINIESLSRGKTLVIHTGAIGLCWDPQSNTKISGSEVMAMNMAKEFHKLGYRTFIFGSFEDEERTIDYQGIYGGIQYIDYRYFPEFSMKYVIDYLIVSRFISNLVYYDNILNVYLWVHDVLPHVEKNSPLFQTHPYKFRGILLLSEWHMEYVIKRVGVPKQMCIQSRNAIYASRFANAEQIQKIPYRFIYMSDAFRGLGYLLDMIPVIKEKYPQTELYIYTRVEHVDEAWMKKIREMDYVHLHPRLKQEEISKELLKSDVWLYPTDFEETYCISALEAMASGCLVATTRLAGLITTVGDRGIMVDPPISLKEKRDVLLNKLFYVMDHPSIKKRYVDKAKDWAMKQTYENLAREWVTMFKL
jgi:tetratricopeptide (TPR) repeat protein